jgi:hypothetical protein
MQVLLELDKISSSRVLNFTDVADYHAGSTGCFPGRCDAVMALARLLFDLFFL